jgi:hypothetical protein
MRFSDILTQYRVPFLTAGHEHCRPGWLQTDCPNCGLTGHYRLGYNLAKGYLSCWSCGWVKLTDYVRHISGLGYREARELTGNVDRIAAPPKRGAGGVLKLPDFVEPLGYAHKKYLSSRGFDPDSIEKLWGVMGIAHAPRLSWRLFIPVIHNFETVSWLTRSIAPADVNERRYRSARETEERVPHKKLLYGGDYVRHAAIIVEGPTDVWAIGPGAVALMGTAYSRAQLLAMRQYPRRFVCFDNERTAQRRAAKLCDDLMVFPGCTANIRLDAKDAATASAADIKKLRELIK